MEKTPNIVKVNDGKYAGTTVIKVSKNPEVDPRFDEVIIRSDGTLTYTGKDLVFAIWKLGLLDLAVNIDAFELNPDGSRIFSSSEKGLRYTVDPCDVLINVIGSEQKKPQYAIKKVIESLYGPETSDKYIHYSYELVKLSRESVSKYFGYSPNAEKVKMSGRKGIYFNVDDIIKKMSDLVYRHIAESREITEKDVAMDIAKKVSIASLKYWLLSIDRDKEVIFDVDKALDFKGESGAYILYSYVRAISILNNLDDIKPKLLDYNVLNRYDLILSRYLVLTPIVIRSAVKYLEPKHIVRHLYQLSKVFTEFYENNPVLKSEGIVKEYRAFIVLAYAKTVEILSSLVGLPLVERM